MITLQNSRGEFVNAEPEAIRQTALGFWVRPINCNVRVFLSYAQGWHYV
jgi:hypothetical protein